MQLFCYYILAISLYMLSLPLVFAVPSHFTTKHPDFQRQSLSYRAALISRESGFNDTASVPNIFERDQMIKRFAFINTSDMANGWTRMYNILDLVSPPTPRAAADLMQFYSDTLMLGSDDWANEAPQPYREASSGSLRLDFQSNEPIPWDFLGNFLAGMVQAMRHGTRSNGPLPGGYKVTFFNALTGAVIVVQMFVPWAGGV